MSVIDTGGLPYEVTLVLHKNYIITTNIDVSDGLANGAVGQLVHIEYNDDREVTRVWLLFPHSRTGEKLRKKAAAHIQANNMNRLAVPIARRTASIPLNNNKTIVAKRNNFPLVSACAITVHKSQGGTFPEVVYEYDKTHSQQLLYVALTRVTSIEGLYIVTKNNVKTFYHGRREPASMKSLTEEFQRLATNRLTTITTAMTDFLGSRNELSLFTFNCQSLRAHAADLTDTVVQRANILLLSETWLKDSEAIDIPNFDCVVQFKRPNVRTGGVAVYHNSRDTINIVTPHIEMNTQQINWLSVNSSAVGDICAVQCVTESGQSIVMIAIYITPGQKIRDIIKFIHRTLLVYTAAGARELDENLDEMPMILSGDFNVNFASDDAKPLTTFLSDKLNLKLNNDPKVPTTKGATTIDAVFSRYLENLQSRVFISYFSYHKPIVSVLKKITE